jgi:hypothetical protein
LCRVNINDTALQIFKPVTPLKIPPRFTSRFLVGASFIFFAWFANSIMANTLLPSYPVKAVWVDGRSKGSRILVDPYRMKMRRKTDTGKLVFFICSKKTDLDCPVTAVLDKESDMIIKQSGDHNHDSDLLKEEIRILHREAIKNAAANPTVAPRTVMMDLSNRALSDATTSNGLAYLPKPRTLARQIQKIRKKEMNVPELPHTWEEYSVPEQFHQTTDGKRFLIKDDTIPGCSKKVVILLSKPYKRAFRHTCAKTLKTCLMPNQTSYRNFSDHFWKV